MFFNTKVSPKLVSLVFAVLVIVFVVGFYIFAWTEPTATAPGDNVSPPLNSGGDPQSKTGNLAINISGSYVTGLAIGGYLQIASVDTGGLGPVDTECDEDSERGRMILDFSNNRLYICNGATRGWDYITLTDI